MAQASARAFQNAFIPADCYSWIASACRNKFCAVYNEAKEMIYIIGYLWLGVLFCIGFIAGIFEFIRDLIKWGWM